MLPLRNLPSVFRRRLRTRQHSLGSPKHRRWRRSPAAGIRYPYGRRLGPLLVRGGKGLCHRAENTGDSDLVIELFSENGQQLIKTEDIGMDGEDETLEYTCPSTGEGIYLARIRLYDGTTFTGNNGYQLTVYHPIAPEIIMVSGRVRDVNSQALVPNIIVISDSGEGYITEPDGFYELYLEPAQFCLRIRQRCLSPITPYSSCGPICYDTIPPQTVQQDINLCPPPLTTVVEVLKLLCAAQTSLSANDLCDVNGDSRPGLEEAIHLLRRIAEIE